MIVGVWDGGRARDTHVGLQGAYTGGPFDNGTKRVLTGSVINSDPNFAYVGISDTAGISSHATHVTGTVLGDGTGDVDGTGFAPRAYAVSLNSSNVDAERRTVRHHFRHVIDTHSYGAQGGSSGGYHATAANWDTDIRDLLMKVNRSAGNEANGGTNDDNTIGDDTCFKNGMIIGAAQDNGVIATFSSRGPSDDGRLMPHFMLNGHTLWSADSGNDTDYGSKSGTSMSTPSATGAQTLLSELYMREMGNRELTPDTAKVVLAVTSTDVYNPGPDYRYGYGIPDIKRAADLILANKASGEANLIRGAVRQGSMMEWELEVTSSSDPLRVICSWLDVQASTQAIPTLINDIDVELVEPNGSTIHYPYSGIPATQGTQTHQFTNTGPNRYDNTEYIEVASPAVGTWVVRVSGFNIPCNPQSGVLNDVCGFVLGCERPFTIYKESAQDALNTNGPIAIPDDDVDGVSRTFTFTEMRKTIAVRVHLDVKHTARGDLDVYLEHPDGTIVHLESADTSTRDDIIAVFPDTRQYDDDVAALLGKRPAGTWKVTVTDTVSGDTGEIRYLSLEVDVDPKNSAPEAVAGPDRTVIEGIVVTLDGTGSSDFDFHPLTYSWAEVGSSLLTLSGANTATATFTTPAVATNTIVTVQLTVDDGNGGSDTDDIVFTIVPPGTNSPPTVGAGPDQFVKFGATVTLAGTASDPDADSLTFLWTQIGGKTTVVISGANSLSPTFTAPGTNDALEFELRVTDLVGYEVTDKVRIGVNASGKAPAPRETGGGCVLAGAAMSPLILIPAFAILARRRRRARHGEEGA
jgi:subtilisin-like proprotein convertase family protein